MPLNLQIENPEIDEAVSRLDVFFGVAADEYADEDHDDPDWKQVILDAHAVLRELRKTKDELLHIVAQGGPLNAERWTLDELIVKLEEWRKIASGRTCVSFESLCYGASSLWHQTHRENFRAVDRKPEELSGWVLTQFGTVHADDFPAQVLGILKAQQDEIARLKEANKRSVSDAPFTKPNTSASSGMGIPKQ